MKELMVLFAACGGTPVQSATPSCFGGTEVGSLNVGYALSCDTRCCTCSLRRVELVSSSGATSTVPRARARAVLDLPGEATNCEATDPGDATRGVRVRFEPDACVVR